MTQFVSRKRMSNRQGPLQVNYNSTEHTLTICTDIIALYTNQDHPLY